jgi:hypothetical protein
VQRQHPAHLAHRPDLPHPLRGGHPRKCINRLSSPCLRLPPALQDMVGYRAPQLVHNPPVRALLEAKGMLYDSSILEFYGPPSESSPNASARLWPYTMDSGIPQDCAYFAGATCTQTERYPGLWEVPLLEMQAPSESPPPSPRLSHCVLVHT